MTEENEEFPNIVRSIFKDLNTRGTDLDIYKTIMQEAASKVGQAESHLKVILNNGEERDKFIEHFESEIMIARAKANDIKTKYEALEVRHKETYEYYGLTEKDNEVKEGSAGFIKCFVDFFKNAVEALPKEEKKRGGGAKGKSGAGAAASNPNAAQAAMMAEMMARNAAKASKAK